MKIFYLSDYSSLSILHIIPVSFQKAFMENIMETTVLMRQTSVLHWVTDGVGCKDFAACCLLMDWYENTTDDE